MDLKYLRTFQAITRTGSFQKAAQALSYAPSTVTFQMKQLEKELGVPLFERRGHQQRLSSVGVAVQPYIENVLAASDKLQSFCQTDMLRGSLTVLLPESLLTYHLQPILEEFRKKAPAVRLSLQVENCFSIYDKMRLGQADVALHYGVGNYPPSFSVRPLRKYPLVLVASPKLSKEDSDFITPNQTKPLCLLLNDARALYLTFFHSYLREKSITLAQEMDVWSLEAIKQCILSNIGIAFLPEFVVHRELNEGTMKEIPVEMEQKEMTAILVRRKEAADNPVIQCFENIVRTHFAAEEEAENGEKG
jgi:DNA-binding transcriptional LysR family regulator